MANHLENKIEELIKELNLQDEISLKGLREIILNEKDGNKEFNDLISMFVSRVPDINRANEIVQIVSEAWNTFPHKSLGGLSPQEVIKNSKES
ncbi:MAG: hypothetical protein A2919_00035 [Candidatus Spechtbacteria bacterium RIFCSPLOWO2_01_FULL_43_12]|uniref:Uncharacterized protein n=1 Tax=Candidatus Spechtbacteria bacterium RIFCSPLOWO2_01_FULL_43_12 TaxID=1802162 RepID=A0A1G2HEU3_9BACT|nr:MAG: hypothetical protein A2919_00035 [Candidatus Spechtbacteria bacterium RIFCSPLOWO2_01_FULL_43_12]